MTTCFRERIFSPLTTSEAAALVRDLHRILDEAQPTVADEAAETAEAPPELDGLTVHSLRRLREDADDGRFDAYESLQIFVDAAVPPTADSARARARATGFAESSFALERDALDRLASCRSTIALEYPGRLVDTRFFVALLKRLLARAGSSVVETDDGTRLETNERFEERAMQELGLSWTRTPAAETSAEREARRTKKRAPRATRAPRPGEVEAIAVHRTLAAHLEGGDPLDRAALREALRGASADVRAYAAALVEEGAHADARLAKVLDRSEDAIAAARTALARLLEDVAD